MNDAFFRIDNIYSVSGMLAAVKELKSEEREAVVLYALSHSRHQYTWSWIAEKVRVPRKKWPPNPEKQLREKEGY